MVYMGLKKLGELGKLEKLELKLELKLEFWLEKA